MVYFFLFKSKPHEQIIVTMARILESGITLIHPNSRSDQKDKFLTVFLVFLKYDCKRNDYDKMTSCVSKLLLALLIILSW